MQFLILIILVKVALTVLAVTLGCMFIAEFFPVLADKAVAASNGTSLAVVGDLISQFLLFCARYAQIVVDFVFSWLQVFGIDVDKNAVGQEVRSLDIDAPRNIDMPDMDMNDLKAPKKIDKPAF